MIIGNVPPFFIRFRSSVASSIIVRSAAKFVSNTFLKPRRRNAATIFPVTSDPTGISNSSPSAARTAGAVCTTTYFPAFIASSTFSISETSINAPVGQTLTHCPHKIQGEFANDLFSAGATIVLNPRFSKPSTESPCAFLQRAMHLPQSTHFDVSRLIAGVRLSTVVSVFAPQYALSLAPVSCATCNSSHFPFLSHSWQSLL